MYDTVGLLKDTFLRYSNLVSRVRWFIAVAENDDADPIPIDDAIAGDDSVDGVTAQLAADANDALARLSRTPFGGIQALRREWATNLGLVGEGYLVARTDPPDVEMDGEIWEYMSVTELVHQGDGQWEVHRPGRPPVPINPDAPDTFVLRTWNPHARQSTMADSSIRSALNDLEEFRLLAAGSRGVAQSRLGRSGILLYDTAALDFPTDDQEAGSGPDNLANNPVLRLLMEASTLAIRDPASAAASVPIVIGTDPDSAVGDEGLSGILHHETLERPLDEQLDRRLQRLEDKTIPDALPLPLDLVRGLGDVNHWSAATITAEAAKEYIVPGVLSQTWDTTTGFLRPHLVEQGHPADVVARVRIWYDPEPITSHPDRAERFGEGYDRLEISGESYRHSIGATDADAPDDEEVAARVVRDRERRTRRDDPGGPLPDAEPDTALIAAAGQPDQLDALGVTLGTIDATVLRRVLDGADRSMDGVLRRAGNRVQSAAQGRKSELKIEARDLMEGVEPREVPARLGPQMVSALGLEIEGLLDGAFDDLEPLWHTWVERGQLAAIAAVEATEPALTAAHIGPELRDELLASAEENRGLGWDVLLALLLLLAGARIFDPNPAAPSLGEHDPTLVVSPDLIREALAVAGGDAVESTIGGGLVRAGTSEPPGGLVTGAAIRDLVTQSLRAQFDGHRWVYGDASARATNFPPHLALDGVTFGTWDDPVLANTAGSWPGVSHWHPGDHSGCLCNFEPLIAFLSDEGASIAGSTASARLPSPV